MNKPSDSVLVAIDVGTSGARASAFTTDGTELAEVRRSYPTALPGEGRAEQDARRWPSAALSALTSLVQDLNAQITAIGLTGQCPSVVPLDRSGQPLRPGIIYRDNRATAEAAQIRERFGDQYLHALTGHLPAAFHVAAKILWIRAHEPDVFAATSLFAQPSDYVGLALTGEPGTDWSVAAATAVLDLRERTWAAQILDGLDLDPHTLPPVKPSWSVIGGLRPALARRLKLKPDTPVIAGAGDSIACAIGAGVTAPGPVSEMAGSSSCFNSVVPEPLADLDITHYPSAVDDHGYVTEVGLNTTGEALDWLAQLFYDRAAPPRRLRPHRARRRSRRPRAPTACCSRRSSATASATTPPCAAPQLACRSATTAARGPEPPWKAWPSACGPAWRPWNAPPPKPPSCGSRAAARGSRCGIRSRPTSPEPPWSASRAIPPPPGPRCWPAWAPASTETSTRRSQRRTAPARSPSRTPAIRGLYDEMYARYLALTGSKEAGDAH